MLIQPCHSHRPPPVARPAASAACPAPVWPLGRGLYAWTSSLQRYLLTNSLRHAQLVRDAVHVSTPAGPCRSCRRARSNSSSSLPTCAGAGHRPSRCGWCAGAHCTLTWERALAWLDELELVACYKRQALQGGAQGAVLDDAAPRHHGHAVAGAGATRCVAVPLAFKRVRCAVRHGPSALTPTQSTPSWCALCTDTPRPLQVRLPARAPGGGSRSRAAP